jgi:serine/threonine protein kinase
MAEGDDVRFAFSGELQLLGRIGQGGMGEVYEAAYTAAGGVRRRVVVKRLLPRLRHEARLRELFFHEARLTAQLAHPHIIQILGIGELQGEPVLVMEHIDGRTLNEVTAALPENEGEDDVAVGLGAAVIRDVGRALAYAHELTSADGTPLRLVHRDVSPSNIMVGYNGAVKLLDFGIAKALASLQDQTAAGVLKGKLGYMAPERLAGEPFDHRSDLFAAGVVLYETLTRRRLYDGQTADAMRALVVEDVPPPSQRNPALPPALDEICARALARDPARRYQTGAQLADALDEVLWQLRWGSGRLAEILRRQRPARDESVRAASATATQTAGNVEPAADVRDRPRERSSSSRRTWRRGLALVGLSALAGLCAVVGWSARHGRVAAVAVSVPTIAVRIDSQPPNAELTLDGDPPLRAQTPFRGRLPQATQTRNLRLRLAGYAPVDLTLRPRGDILLDIPLQPIVPRADRPLPDR